jgi:hypothetical protein
MTINPQSTNRPAGRRRLPRIGNVVFFCTLVMLLAGLGWTIATRRTLNKGVRQLRSEHLRLSESSNKWKEAASESSADTEVLMRVFRHCRSADDIPNLGGDRIVSNLIDSKSVVFYVPGGSHELLVTTSWEAVNSILPRRAGTADESAVQKSETDPSLAGNKSWTVPLLGDHGYFFTVVGASRKETRIGWELSSNAAGFETRVESLPFPALRTTGSSWSSFRIVRFPNEVALNTLIKDRGATSPAVPLRIGRWTKSGRIEKTNIKISFELSLTSDCPPVISATIAETLLILRKDDMISRYLGGGRYETRAAQ